MKALFSLEGRNAWITGAAYGIGFAIAQAFVEAGIDNIIFNTSNEASMQKGLAAYREAGITNVHGYVCDVTDEAQVKALVERIHAEVGPIHILVNNAGIIKRIPMHEMKREDFQRVIDVDLVGPYICSAAVLPEMTVSFEDTSFILSAVPQADTASQMQLMHAGEQLSGNWSHPLQLMQRVSVPSWMKAFPGVSFLFFANVLKFMLDSAGQGS